ncbi:hypothetical protein DFP72DRAFT_134555 [Ephemerocybe angulata]|uniref:Secreted protein n=1 Tax=Ephemerocybe angulata TaxID=980116 RepID=A0A8H6M8Z3_9AGAR|nr:hypothetical protein DFP72DRAFT_134555 [Tulosesus angulatus]
MGRSACTVYCAFLHWVFLAVHLVLDVPARMEVGGKSPESDTALPSLVNPRPAEPFEKKSFSAQHYPISSQGRYPWPIVVKF